MTSCEMEDLRNGDKGSLNSTLLASLLLHALILSLVLFTPSFPSPKWTFGPIYSVELVTLADSMSSPPRTSLSHEFTESSLPGRATTFRKHVEPQTTPIRRIETPAKTPTDMDRIMERVRQRASEVKAPPRALGDRKAAAASSRDVELTAKMNAYYAAIWSRIRGQWALPTAIMPKEDIEAVIRARISRMGAVADLAFEKSSGNRYFDESAMKAVRKASPFPPLPDGFTDSGVELGIRFHSAELR